MSVISKTDLRLLLAQQIEEKWLNKCILTDQVPSRLTTKLPLKRVESIWEMTYKFETRADCRMMGMLEV